MLKKELSPNARNLMIREVVEQNQSIASVAKKYNISRVTFYKWLKRYKDDLNNNQEPNFLSKKPVISRYWHQVSDEYKDSVLSLVNKHPEWGIRTIVKNLPKVGNTPIVGHHGVQNILRRNNLSTYEDRLNYVQSQRTPIVRTIEKILGFVTGFFRFPVEKRQKIIRFSTITLFSSFITIVVFGLINYLSISIGGVSVTSKMGMIFASIALLTGSFFFLYSLKYYLTLAIVLSYSQSDANNNNGLLLKSNLIDWILGNNKSSNNNTTTKKAVGLEPDLKSVSLDRKPFISVHIPFYNEKMVVERSIHAAISFDYLAYEVILCDDSTDETTQIIKSRMERYLLEGEKLKTKRGKGYTLTEVEIRPGVILKHLHRTARSGFKGGALNLALRLSNPKTEFISIFDADFVPYPDSLELFLKYLKVQNNMSEDYSLSNVAAVQGYQWHVLNKSENWITRGVRSEYSGSYVIERSGTETYGGLKQISGSVYMIRKNILEEIGWGTSITEDFELTLKIYQAGYKVVYTPYIQAPAECVSTLKRLIRQRMRWAEGHSFNIKKMFVKMLLNPKITSMEKMELTYLTPYYLQAFFFLVGTISWLISEAVFRTRLPFWTEFWGWSLILTNMISLPLLNSVGLFLEESEERDYLGLGSFIALSYILVPFQAYAAVKGFLEKKEGTWFRTPKTGKITDIFSRNKFYRFIQGIIPGKGEAPALEESYLALATANNKFNSFNIKPRKNKWVGKAFLSVLLTITVSIYSVSGGVPEVLATDYAETQYLRTGTTGTLTNARITGAALDTGNTVTATVVAPKLTALGRYEYRPGSSGLFAASTCADGAASPYGWIFDVAFQSGGSIASGAWQFTFYESDSPNSQAAGDLQLCAYKVTVSGGAITGSTLLFDTGSDATWPITDIIGNDVTNTTYTTQTENQFNFNAGEYLLINYHFNLTNTSKDTTTIFTGGDTAGSDPLIILPTITIPENALLLLAIVPFIPMVTMWLKRKRLERGLMYA